MNYGMPRDSITLTDVNNKIESNQYLTPHHRFSGTYVYARIGMIERLVRWLFSFTGQMDTTTEVCAKRSLETLKTCLMATPGLMRPASTLLELFRKTDMKASLIGKAILNDKDFDVYRNTLFCRYSPNPSPPPSEKCKKIQEELDRRGVELNANPPLPEPGHFKKVEESIEENLKKYPADSPILKLYAKLQKFTIKDLEIKLKGCVEELSLALKKMGSPDYAVGIVEGKSNQWVAELALKYMDQLPSHAFFTGINDNGSVDAPGNCTPSKIQEKVVVLFDDNSCTGCQIERNLETIFYQSIEMKTKITVFVVVPFMKIDPAQIKKYKPLRLTVCNPEKLKKANVDIKIITSDTRIQKVSDAIKDEKEVELLACHGKMGQRGLANYAWSLFEWRRLDAMSFPTNLTLEIIPDIPRPYALKKQPY